MRADKDICLVRATISDAKVLYNMQIKSFMPLLEKYKDYDTSPASGPIEKVIARINQPFTHFYLIQYNKIPVGGIRVVILENSIYRISPIFVLPEYQGKGIAQKVFALIEESYTEAKGWELDTILQEKGNCYLYQKLGYKQTGKTQIVNDKLTLVFYKK